MITVQDVEHWDKRDVYAENERQQAAIRDVLGAAGFAVDTMDFDMGRQIGVLWRATSKPSHYKAQRFALGTDPQEVLVTVRELTAAWREKNGVAQ